MDLRQAESLAPAAIAIPSAAIALALGFPGTGLWIAPLWLAGAVIAAWFPGGRPCLVGIAGMAIGLAAWTVVFEALIGRLDLAAGAASVGTILLFLVPPYAHGWVGGWLARRARRLGIRAVFDTVTLTVGALEIGAAAYAYWLAQELEQHPL